MRSSLPTLVFSGTSLVTTFVALHKAFFMSRESRETWLPFHILVSMSPSHPNTTLDSTKAYIMERRWRYHCKQVQFWFHSDHGTKVEVRHLLTRLNLQAAEVLVAAGAELQGPLAAARAQGWVVFRTWAPQIGCVFI